MDSYTVTRLPHGGFVVTEGIRNPDDYRSWLVASTTVEEALAWVKNKLDPTTK